MLFYGENLHYVIITIIIL